MKKTSSLRASESGVIHHLGLIILSVVVLAGVSFAIFQVVQKNADSNDAPVSINADSEEEGPSEKDVANELNQAQNDANKSDDNAEAL